MANQGEAQPPSSARPTALRSNFSVARKGFDQAEVIAYLGGVDADMRALQADAAEARRAADELRAKVAELEARVEAAPAAEVRLDEEAIAAAVGEEMANVIRTARTVADDLRSRATAEADAALMAARSEADEVLRRVRDQADRILTSARTEAEETLTGARAQAEETLASARTEAERTTEEAKTLHASRLDEAARKLAEATAEAERHGTEVRAKHTLEAEQVLARASADAATVRSEAERERRLTVEGAQQARERILADLARRRRVATVQIEQLRAGRERLLVSYAIVRRTLEEVSEEFQRADAEARAAAEEVGKRLAAELDLEPAGAGPDASADADGGEGSADAGLDTPSLTDDQPSVEETLGASDDDDDAGAEDPGAGGEDPGPDGAGTAAADDEQPEPPAGEASAGEASADDASAAGDTPVLAAATESHEGDEEPRAGTLFAGGPPAVPGAGPAVTGGGDQPGFRASAGTWGAAGARVQPRSAVRIIRPDEPGATAPAGPEARRDGTVVLADAEPGAGAGQEEARGGVALLVAEADVGEVEVAEERVAEVEVAEVEVAEGPAPLAGESVRVEAGPADAVAGLFARIRANRQEAVAQARQTLADGPETATEEAPPSPASTEPAAEAAGQVGTAGAAESAGAPDARYGEDMQDAPDVQYAQDVQDAQDAQDGEDAAELGPDERLLRRRDEVLDEVRHELTRRLKRELQDEQSELLHRLRSLTVPVTLDALLPERDDHVGRYTDASAGHLGVAVEAGARIAAQDVALPQAVTVDVTAPANALAEALVAPLRRRLESLVHDLADDDERDALVDAISAAYREIKTQRVEGIAMDGLCAAFGRGWWAALPEGTPLRWVASDAGAGGACADCYDNTLAGATARGEAFPTGELFPPAHDGCRCLLVVDGA